jgi:hypothetical protein
MHDFSCETPDVLGRDDDAPADSASTEFLIADEVVDLPDGDGEGAGGLFTAIEELFEGDDIRRLLHFSSFRPLATVSRVR